MQRNISLFFSVALFAAVVVPACFAAPAQTISTDGSGSDANVLNISGTLPEYIHITSIDNTIVLKRMSSTVPLAPTPANNMADAKFVGDVDSGSITANNQAGENGYADVSFDSNTYVSVSTTVNRLKNAGFDHVFGNGDDVYLPTQYARAIKGRSVRVAGNTQSPFTLAAFGYNTGFFNATSDGLSLPMLTFGPGADSGFRIRTKFTRNGLNDPSGAYTATLNHSYLKY